LRDNLNFPSKPLVFCIPEIVDDDISREIEKVINRTVNRVKIPLANEASANAPPSASGQSSPFLLVIEDGSTPLES